MKAIAAVDKNWGIGYKEELLEKIPEDLQFFRRTTLGKAVVMGRTTFESLPGGQPLKDRTNIVLSSHKDFGRQDIIVCRSLEELFKKLSAFSAEDVYVAGGTSVYAALLSYCTEAIITRFGNTHPVDRFFPDLDADGKWIPEMMSADMRYGDVRYDRIRYVNSQTSKFP